MSRMYELGFIIDPRTTEEEAVALTDAVKELLVAGGAELTKEESWGKRRLAYPINKLNEGRYIFLFLNVENGSNPFPEVERRLNQNDKILRYLTVRTDEGLKRQETKGKKPREGRPDAPAEKE